MNPPENKSHVRPNRLHGLTFDTAKGRWRLKLTLDLGDKVVGKRVSFALSTSDTDSAVDFRDAIVRGYQKLGLTVRTRGQKRARCKRVKPVLMLPAPVVEIEPVQEPEPPQMDPSDPRRWGTLRGRGEF